jgi:hypothetical protein
MAACSKSSGNNSLHTTALCKSAHRMHQALLKPHVQHTSQYDFGCLSMCSMTASHLRLRLQGQGKAGQIKHAESSADR